MSSHVQKKVVVRIGFVKPSASQNCRPASAVSNRHTHLTSNAILLFSSTEPQRRRFVGKTRNVFCVLLLLALTTRM